MKKILLIIRLLTVTAALFIFIALSGCSDPVDRSRKTGAAPHIMPDYTDITIPPNIAPLNFTVKEPGTNFMILFSSQKGEGFTIKSTDNKISVPEKKWHSFLKKNKGNDFAVTVYAKDTIWKQYTPITNHIAQEPIDRYLAYRKLKPAYHRSGTLILSQRNLESFSVTRLLHNDSLEKGAGCMNCHTFLNNNPDKMSLHIRGAYAGTMLLNNDSLFKVDTRTERNKRPGAFASWHPSGSMLAFSINSVRQLCHTARQEVREAFDVDSDIFLYFIDNKTALSPPLLRQPDRLETFPAWSSDGKWLYFSSAPKLWDDFGDDEREIVDYVEKVQYDLMRIGYDPATKEWGSLDTLLSADATGMSIVEPRISPSGKFLVFCMTPWSWMPSFSSRSDLYIMDLTNMIYKKLECSSEGAESWHSWSSNSRWLAFSSKRYDGQILRTYFSYIDTGGTARKAFLLPQKKPDHYESSIWMYHLPELITGAIPITEKELLQAIRSSRLQESEAVTGATIKAPTGPRH
ncbi:MAG: hypothetical protein GF401_06555 [Chitinivibrionales bacterium]|nr:hypothetical protein [Chitinivibrionales bacterium]